MTLSLPYLKITVTDFHLPCPFPAKHHGSALTQAGDVAEYEDTAEAPEDPQEATVLGAFRNCWFKLCLFF